MGVLIRRYRGAIPYLLLAPGILWLIVFYAYPSLQILIASFWSGTLETGFTFSLSNWTTYPDALSRYQEQFFRSIVYAGSATILTFLIAYPLAYTIAFRGGRYKNLLLFMVVAPFFTSFLLRTISWKIILGDTGIFLGPLKDFGLVGTDFRLLATPVAVISGITYNFLPFMTLPIYVSLEKIDRRLVEAAQDLYAGPWRPGGTIAGIIVSGGLFAVLAYAFNWAYLPMIVVGAIAGAIIGTLFVSQSFLQVTLPLSLPGVFAGSLLVMIPAMGDYVNASLLGNPNTNMIGNVIQSRFLTNADYPTASALSFMLMAMILVAVTIYGRLLGTENLTTGRGI
jgi:spermidine/putrescine transport system permease protein